MNAALAPGALAVLLIAMLSGCTQAWRDQPTRAVAAASPVALATWQPRDGLLVAGQPATGDWGPLHARGVATVVNLRTVSEMQARDEAAEVRAAGMTYVAIPVEGTAGITVDNARRLHEVLASTRAPVLVHCASGNRAGGLLALMVGRFEGEGAEQALALGRDAGMTSSEARVRLLLGE